MSDELLPYYNRELSFIRTLGAEFARNHPKIAARLRLGADESQDPHVERMIQAFAYLNARVRHKLDDDFPEITDALLDVLYPHYLAPIPSMAITQFVLDRSQAALTAGYDIRSGTAVESEPVEEDRCRFSTCYPVKLWPIELQTASLSGRPFAAPSTPRSQQAIAVVRLVFKTLAPDVKFSQFKLDRLRLFLHAAQNQNVYDLYELLFNHTIEIALASNQRDPTPVLLPKTSLEPVGFGRNEGMFPYDARSFLGYRLLSEYFAFPKKFLFCDLAGLEPRKLAAMGDTLEVYFYLNRTVPDLERNVSADTFRLGCAPMVNLFPHRCDPFVLHQRDADYRVIPDARRPRALEIYSVNRVLGTSPAGDQAEYMPFFSFKHAADATSRSTFWQATRRLAASLDDAPTDHGTDTYLTLADLEFSPAAPADWTIDVETTCLNRDLPARLPFGGGRPDLDLPDGRGPVAQVICLTPPTPTLRAPQRRRAMWRVISHLSLNHLSLADDADGAHALREILKLYDVAQSAETQDMIRGVLRVGSKRVVGRAGGVCKGIEVNIQFDEEKFTGSGAYLFAAVLDRFLGLYVSINSFSKLVASTKQRGGQGEPWRWPLRAGEKVLL